MTQKIKFLDKVTVTVKNRLKGKYGKHHVDIWKNNAKHLVGSVFPGYDVDLPDARDTVPIETLLLEPVTQQTSIMPLGTDKKIAIKIRANRPCKVSLLENEGKRKWKIDLTDTGTQLTTDPVMMKSKPLSTEAVTKDGPTSGESDVNVTIEEDEDMGSPPPPTTAFILMSIAVGALLTRFFIEKFPNLWWLVPVVPGVLGVGLFIYKKIKANKSDEIKIVETATLKDEPEEK